MIAHRLSRIDHLRAIAALLVATWHFTHTYVSPKVVPVWGILSIFEEGYTGVSLFCVISGFIFTYLYTDRLIPYAAFIRKRLLRIAPLFVFILALSYYVSPWDNSSVLAMFLTTLYRGGLPSYIGPGWSVLIEFQFYFVFPFLLLFARQYGIRYLAGLLMLFIAVRCLVFVSTRSVQFLAYYSIFGRIDQFLCGMIVAIVLKDPKWSSPFQRSSLLNVTGFLVALTSVAVLFWWFNVNGGFENFDGGTFPVRSAIWIYFPTVEAVLYALLLGFYMVVPALPGTRALSATFAFLGLISYSIYLDHLLLFPFVHWLIATTGFVPATWEHAELLALFVAVPLLVVVASATYFMIERPFLRIKDTPDFSEDDPTLVGGGARVVVTGEEAHTHGTTAKGLPKVPPAG